MKGGEKKNYGSSVIGGAWQGIGLSEIPADAFWDTRIERSVGNELRHAHEKPPHPGRSIKDACLDALGPSVTGGAKVLGCTL